MRRTAVRMMSLAALFATAACDGDGSGGSRLSPGEVAAVYRVCSLRFVPENNQVLPAADLMTRVVSRTPPAGKPEPTLTLGQDGRYQLFYTEQRNSFTRDLQGQVGFGAETVRINFYSGDNRGEIPTELLLPARVDLEFSDSPRRRLATSPNAQRYPVARRDYAQAAGISESGLAPEIFGSLDATFREGSCN